MKPILTLEDELVIELSYDIKMIDTLADEICKRQAFLIKTKIAEENND